MKQPLCSPLEQALLTQLRLLETTLQPSTISSYRGVMRHFLDFLRRRFPQITHPHLLQRDPHLLTWLEELWTYRNRHGRPLSQGTRGERVLLLRTLLERMREDLPRPPAANLLRSSDVPPRHYPLPRPLNADDDLRLCDYWHSATGLLDSALYLMRLTGMRIGECVDLAPDCLRHLGDQRWSIHVPHGKPRSERWVPVDDLARSLLDRLAFLRTLPPGPTPDFLLPRPRGRDSLLIDLRHALASAAAQAAVSGHVVPHQLRHTYATSLLRAGVSLPALMRLLGHHNANMTLIYVEVTQHDLHREYHAARQNPRYLIPSPPPLWTPQPAVTAASFDDALDGAIRFLRARCDALTPLPDRSFLLLARRLQRIRSLAAELLRTDSEEK
jgi:integrase